MTGPGGLGGELRIVNPLPSALHHYEQELRDVLATCAELVVRSDKAVTVEMSDGEAPSRPGRAVATLLARSRRGPAATRLVLWPVFGLADAITWWRYRPGTWLVVHDPKPLRRQVGMGRFGAWVGGVASRHDVGVIVHSIPAHDVLTANRWDTVVLPHPIKRPDPAAGRPGGRRLTVLGQWKPARSLEPLRVLASADEWRDRRDVVGRGWPELAGWSVDSRFISEAELIDRIDAAACVVLPYHRYFQSNIAVRCLEQCTPVVGRPHPFLENLFGSGWPGLVVDDDWSAAAARASEVTIDDLRTRRQDYWERCTDAWQNFAQRLVSPEGFRSADQ
jgi:hypothetical protein